MKKVALAFLTIGFTSSLMAKMTGGWNVSIEKDEMTNKKTCYTSGKWTKSTKSLSFPYNDLTQTVGIGIDYTGKYWSYIAFSNAPNLTDETTGDGYGYATRRIKFDNNITNFSFSRDWGSRFAHTANDDDFIDKLMTSKTMLTEQEQYGNGTIYYKFNLTGMQNAYDSCRKSLGLNSYAKDKAMRDEAKAKFDSEFIAKATQLFKMVESEQKEYDVNIVVTYYGTVDITNTANIDYFANRDIEKLMEEALKTMNIPYKESKEYKIHIIKE